MLSSVFKRAVKYGECDFNPVLGAALPDRERLDVDDKDDDAGGRALTREQMDVLLSFVRDSAPARRADVTDIIEVMAATGMRIGEVLALRWTHTDLTKRLIHVNGTAYAVRGEGVVRGRTKSKRSKREVPSTMPLPRSCAAASSASKA